MNLHQALEVLDELVQEFGDAQSIQALRRVADEWSAGEAQWGARFEANTNDHGTDKHAAMEEAAAYGGVFVSRRVTPWVDADPSGETS
jgi:hypothetical protein